MQELVVEVIVHADLVAMLNSTIHAFYYLGLLVDDIRHDS